jgi:predicted lipid-binding transport protein (Tim44 family)
MKHGVRSVMRRSFTVLALALAIAIAIAPALAFARAGGGSSFGSRGSRTYSSPGITNTSPYGASPFQRSITPQSPGYGGGSYGQRPYGGGFGFGGRPFMSGLLGGFLGAGLGGLLFGRGFFGGIGGFGGFFGFLLQMFLIVLLVRWLFRLFLGRQFAPAGGMGGLFARNNLGAQASGYGARPGPGPSSRPITITQTDYLSFEQNLKLVQQAWSRHDLNTLRQICTPEMASYFAEQMAEQTSRGVRNTVSEVRLDQGDLAEAWAEPGREYATVAMRFSMIDVTRDAAGHVVDGSPNERVSATEYWTFVRAPGARWILSAIQQGR